MATEGDSCRAADVPVVELSYLERRIARKLAELPPGPVSDGLVCKCGGCIMVISRQTRKSDEGMTVFYKCAKCTFTKKKN